MAEALLAWVQAVGSTEVTQFSDLADGVVLVDIAMRISPDLFDDSGFNRVTDGNWLLNATNIKILVAQMSNVYNHLIKKDPTAHVSKIDANAIARDNDVHSTQRLVELVLGAAVQCEAKDEFIRAIMSMPQASQQVLMGLIQTQMTSFPSVEPEHSSPVLQSASPPTPGLRHSFSEDLRDELDALQAKYDELHTSFTEQGEESESLRERVKQLSQELKESKNKAHDLKGQLKHAEVKADDLQIDVDSSKQQVEAREEQIKQMRKQIEEKQSQDSNQALLDELDVLRDKLLNAQKNEALLSKAKKKLEELPELQAQIKSLEETNATLVKERNTAAGSSSKASTIKADLDGAHSQITKLEDQIKELKAQVSSGERELDKACLLYTSDAADDLLCVDLGGRRIIKKKREKRVEKMSGRLRK
eukprot:TRINITY_DN1666_c0_g2_i1.p1 TRINITY_DN1666_c0_g2~~TRINITY_DN1666_c0_g2_i1.p1  ORF type:complete len:418 (+),score=172.29 TRINITY_DN1666_c0_g2_i1:229-1482(+)